MRHKVIREYGGRGKMKRDYKIWLLGILILVVGLTLLVISHFFPSFSQCYATKIYQNIFPPISLLVSNIPFSIYEILILLLSIFIIFGIIRDIIRLFSKLGREKLKKDIKKIPLRLIYTIAILLIVFVFTAGINYARESYTDYIGIEAQPSHPEELIHLYHRLLEQTAEIIKYVEADSSGYFILNRENILEEAQSSLSNLNKIYGGLGHIFPRAKTLLFSRYVFDNFGFEGFFSPFTLEAHYNHNAPSTKIPFLITHELAHAVGYMREEEANFIAFLACKYSDNTDFQYSGHFEALLYTLGALRRDINREYYAELYFMMPEQVIRDINARISYLQRFEGSTTVVVSQRVNDAYLKMNRQEDGIKSYGRMVDLLLAYYRVYYPPPSPTTTQDILGGLN